MADPSFIVRLPQSELEALDAWQSAKGYKSRNIAAREAMRLGMLEARPSPAAVPIAHTPATQPVASPPMPRVGTGRPADFGPKVDVSKLDVPLASEVQRQPMQRKPKGSALVKT